MKWITREQVHVDRIVCPWLIRRFIDFKPEFIFVPTEKINEAAKAQDAKPFDAPSVRLGHRDGKCSFETIIEEYSLRPGSLRTCRNCSRCRHAWHCCCA